MRCLRTRSSGVIGVGSSEKFELGWLDSTHVSTLLLPYCIETDGCRSAPSRVKPPGITDQPPSMSAIAYTRSTAERPTIVLSS